jgi:uncharacterized OB-fold protein
MIPMSVTPARTPVQEGLFDETGLIGGSCASCEQRHFPLAGHCPWCGTAGPTACTLSSEGRLWAWTVVTAPPPGYEGPLPYGFGVVDLPADGLQIVTMLTESDPDRLHLGDAMRFTVTPLTDDTDTWAFAPVPS